MDNNRLNIGKSSFPAFWDSLTPKLKLFDYEQELAHLLQYNKYIRIKKSTGLGITEFMLRWIAWKCFNDEKLKAKHVDVDVVIITGPRLELAVQLIDRLKKLFDYNFETKNTVCELNGLRIEAFPSHHVESARGLSPSIIYLDEADFFPVRQQIEVRSVAERYIAKSDPYIIMVSTAYNPGGLYDTMDREDKFYKLIEWNYEVGLKAGIYTAEQIEMARKTPSFEREYNLQYGVGVGNLYPSAVLDQLVEIYDLTFGPGAKVRCIDPAYGSSKFAILEAELTDGIIYPKFAKQFDRPSPTAITQQIVERNTTNPMLTLVDSAHPGLIRDLQDRNVMVREIKFNQELSNMTIAGVTAVKEKKVRFHPDECRQLIAQLKAVELNDRGHPDKTKLNFDLGDTFQMAANHFKKSTFTTKSANTLKDQYDDSNW